jgi:SAM-dependent methyltransferase
MYSDPICPPLKIPPEALVLDVGSGHRPHPRADVLCDKYLMDNSERGGAAIVDRPLVVGDVQSLPFRGGAFDYVITRHVLEHVENPAAFFREIMRVGAAGYIETPSLIWEYLHPSRRHHKWVLLKLNDTILMAPKPPELYDSVLGSVIEEMGMNSLEYGLLIKAYKDLFYVRHEWSGTVRCKIYSSIDQAPALFRSPWNGETARLWVARQKSLQQAKNLLHNLIDSAFGRAMRGYTLKQEQRQLKARLRQRPIDLSQVMMCPICQSTRIEIKIDAACCQDCQWQTRIWMPQLR